MFYARHGAVLSPHANPSNPSNDYCIRANTQKVILYMRELGVERTAGLLFGLCFVSSPWYYYYSTTVLYA